MTFGNKMWNLTHVAHVAACTMKGALAHCLAISADLCVFSHDIRVVNTLAMVMICALDLRREAGESAMYWSRSEPRNGP
eukprot:427252-Amphidinium_carterae.1